MTPKAAMRLWFGMVISIDHPYIHKVTKPGMFKDVGPRGLHPNIRGLLL